MNIKTYYLLVISVAAIQIQLSKKNICILILNKTNVELIPTTISLQTFVTNTIPSFADYFDSFYFLTQPDLECYIDAVKNQFNLYPCPFLSSHNSMKSVMSSNSKKITKSIQNYVDNSFINIIDNTLFPYPDGAYSYDSIKINIITSLEINISSTYQSLGVRLIFINSTVLLMFIVVIAIIIGKTKLLMSKMNKGDNNKSSQNDLEEVEDYETSVISEQAQLIRDRQRMLKQQQQQLIITENIKDFRQQSNDFLQDDRQLDE